MNDGPPPIPNLDSQLRVIVTTVERPPPAAVDACSKLYSGLLLDHLGKHGALASEIKAVFPGARVCGPALTVLGADWRLRFAAADIAQPGDVVVIASGSRAHACFGDVTATRWRAKGIAGVVVDGAVRDVAGLRSLGFPAFAAAVTPRTFHYPAGVDHGAVNVPIACGGVVVTPGDLVLGDDDGVVIVPRAAVAAVAAAGTEYLAKENAKRAAFAEGRAPVGAALDDLRERGYRVV